MRPSSAQPSLPTPHVDEEEYPDDSRMIMSPSAVISYMADPAKYYFKKILKRREPSGKHRLEGSAYHAAIEHALLHKQKRGTLAPIPQVEQYLDTFWEEELKKMDPAARPDPGRLGYVKAFLPQIYDLLANTTPKYIEHYVRRPVPGATFDIHGYIDLIRVRPGHQVSEHFDPRTDVVTDYKSKGASPTKNKAGDYLMSNYDKLQLTMYAWALTGGHVSVKGEITYLVKTKTPKIITIETTITAEEQRRRVETVGGIVESIRNKVFTPNYGHYSCSPEKCLFWKECHELF